MDSALRPAEIQARIRSGQSLAEVAEAAGVPAERIEGFAAPVLAEREHVALMALSAGVRRRGETAAHRNLRPVVAERLTRQGVDPDELEWDAWRDADRRWTVSTHFPYKGEEVEALFRFDQAGRFSIALSDGARWLISEPNGLDSDDDELALVRAVSEDASPAQQDSPTDSVDEDDPAEDSLTEESPADEDELTEDLGELGTDGSDRADQADRAARAGSRSEDEEDQLPRSAVTPAELAAEVENELDSYGVVPEGRSELDVLYDMLGGLAEDSINIYAGLSDPVIDELRSGSMTPEQLDAALAESAETTADQDDDPDSASGADSARGSDSASGADKAGGRDDSAVFDDADREAYQDSDDGGDEPAVIIDVEQIAVQITEIEISTESEHDARGHRRRFGRRRGDRDAERHEVRGLPPLTEPQQPTLDEEFNTADDEGTGSDAVASGTVLPPSDAPRRPTQPRTPEPDRVKAPQQSAGSQEPGSEATENEYAERSDADGAPASTGGGSQARGTGTGPGSDPTPTVAPDPADEAEAATAAPDTAGETDAAEPEKSDEKRSAAADEDEDERTATQADKPAAEAKARPGAKRTPKSGKKRRASIPSWDEIMFGGPGQDGS